MFTTNHHHPFADDGSAGSRRSSNHDHRSMISASTTTNNNDAVVGGAFNPAAAASLSYNAFSSVNTNGGAAASFNNAPVEEEEEEEEVADEDPLTIETQNAITHERLALTKENTARLQSILENIKDSTKNILNEMNVFLKETEEVEKMYVRCRAETLVETRRLEQVEPEVMGMLSGVGAAAGGAGAMNMMGMFGGNEMMMGM